MSFSVLKVFFHKLIIKILQIKTMTQSGGGGSAYL